MRNRVKTSILVPQYAELELRPLSFTITVTLPITKEVYDIMKPLNTIEREKNMECSVFYTGGEDTVLKSGRFSGCNSGCRRHYAQITRWYEYTVSPNTAMQRDAHKQLACLQAIICKAKVALLNKRISNLEEIFMEED